MADAPGYLGTQFPVPTDPQYYLGQAGLGQLAPQAFNADTLSAMFAPQGMQFTPVNSMATNPFLTMFMDQMGKQTHLNRPQVPGQQQPPQIGMEGPPQ